MGIFSRSTHLAPRLDFELTQACDQACAHCYNVWSGGDGEAASPDYPRGILTAEEYVRVMERAVTGSGARQLTITGGEPLLHPGALQIIARACELVRGDERTAPVQVITNGGHVSPRTAGALGEAGVRSVQLTLLSADPEKHDRLKGAASFADTTRAALDLRDAGVRVQACFVATSENWRDLPEVLELCLVLGIDTLSYNRMSPAGGAIQHVRELMPSVRQVESNLDTAEHLGRRWKIQVTTAMPILPCLIRIARYRWVKFGFCSVGTPSPNPVVDPLGNVRSCNLSSHIMGNLVQRPWREVMRDPHPRSLAGATPKICRGCAHEASCKGGCKESALATFGAADHPEPLLHLALERRPAAPEGDR